MNIANEIIEKLQAYISKNGVQESILPYFKSHDFTLYNGDSLEIMTTIKKTESFGEHLRTLREDAELTLKTVAEQINIDTSLLAKIERNERQPTKKIIKQVSEYFNVDEKELKNNFLSDQIASKIIEEEADLSILKVAEEKVKYLKTVQNGK